MTAVGEWMRADRKARGLSGTAYALLVGLRSPQHVSRIECGHAIPTWKTVERLEHRLGLDRGMVENLIERVTRGTRHLWCLAHGLPVERPSNRPGVGPQSHARSRCP